MKGKRRASRIASFLCAVVLMASFGVMCACGNGGTASNEPSGQWYYGAETPADNLGSTGDYYLNTETLASYVKTEDGEWTETAANWYYGTEDPSPNLGAPNDFYLNTETGKLYQKGIDSWGTSILTLKGEKGRDGVVWFSGETDPEEAAEGTFTDAEPGDFYLNTTEFTVWQLETDGKTWNRLGTLKPEDGEKGSDGNVWYYGTTEPEDAALSAKEGDFYMRSFEPVENGAGMYTGYKIYFCRADGSWKLVIDNSPCAFLGTAHTFETQDDRYACTTCGYVAYTYSEDRQTISFGEYPQSQVTDTAIAEALTAKAGVLPTAEASGKWTSYRYYVSGKQEDFMWYQDVELGGFLYRGVYFTQYRPNATDDASTANFQNRNGYSVNTVYWFKYEPVTWRILKEEKGKMLVMANTVLDSQAYDTDYDNYKDSDIRAWLSETFLKTTFYLCAQKYIIQETEVDNSAATLPTFADPAHACDNTQDKVFLLSYQEAKNKEYFKDSAALTLNADEGRATAYALSQGLQVFRNQMLVPEGGVSWWLRSAATGTHDIFSPKSAAFVGTEGGPCEESSMLQGDTGNSVASTALGIVPAMWVVTDAE